MVRRTVIKAEISIRRARVASVNHALAPLSLAGWHAAAPRALARRILDGEQRCVVSRVTTAAAAAAAVTDNNEDDAAVLL